MDEINPLCFPLLRWILRSNRSSLALLPPAKQVKGMKTKLQFQVVTAFPELEQKFQSWKEQARQMGKGIVRIPGQGSKAATKKGRQSGSYNAWHGSPINNFHSILRTGLRGGHVPGIYHAQNAATSFGYMA